MRTYLIWATGYSCYVLGQMHGKGHTHWKNALVALAVGALWPAAVCYGFYLTHFKRDNA